MKVKTAYRKYRNNGNPAVINDLVGLVLGSTKLGKKSQFKLQKDIASFSISPSSSNISCRQFYKNSTGLLAYVADKNKFLYFHRKDLNITGKVSRIAPDGTVAINALVDDPSKYDKAISKRFNKILKNLI